jgi:hypothetical protein
MNYSVKSCVDKGFGFFHPLSLMVQPLYCQVSAAWSVLMTSSQKSSQMPIWRKSLSSFKAYSSEMLESIKQAKTVWPLGQQAFGWFCSERKFLLKHTDVKRFGKTLFRYQEVKEFVRNRYSSNCRSFTKRL